MILWLIIAGVGLVVVLATLRPLIWPPQRDTIDDENYDLTVYAAQLRDIEKDHQQGRLDAQAATEARAEIERRMLAADSRARRAGAFSRPVRLALGVLVVLGLTGGASALYLRFGSPSMPGVPFASRELPPSGADAALFAEIRALDARTQQDPADVEGWVMYGRALFTAARYEPAVEAYRRAVDLTGGRGDVVALYGEALVYAATGVVTAAAITAFEQAPTQPRARFYMALADYQAGRQEPALDGWLALAAEAPPGAPWLPAVEARIEAVAVELGRDPAPLLSARSTDQTAQIRSMVEGLAARLEAAPEDIEGWRMLARSYQVLGETQRAANAWARAAELAPDDPDVLVGYGIALMQLGDQSAPMPDTVVALMDRALALDAENVDALWFTGVASMQGGDPDTALAKWRQVLRLLPEESAERRVVEQQIKRVTR